MATHSQWAKYKDFLLNVSEIKRFSIEKATFSKGRSHDGIGIYTGNLVVKKSKPWVLYADHEPIAAFTSDTAALKVAEDIVTGKYDV